MWLHWSPSSGAKRKSFIEFYIIRDSELCLFSPSPLGEGRGEGLSVPIVILYVTLNSNLEAVSEEAL
jgi:hypothetical protein